MSKKPVVIVCRDHLLYPSETFVLGQAEALKNYSPYYVGSRLVGGLPLPADRTIVINRGGLLGKMGEVSYKLWGVAPGFAQRVRKLNPVLIHAHFGPDGVRFLPLARALRAPLIVTFHGFDATVKDDYARRSFYSHRVYLRGREALKREARLFVAVSNYVREKLLEQGFPPAKVLVHYTGVGVDMFQPDQRIPRKPIVLFVGRLVEKKGCEYLIWAMRKVQMVMPEVELVVIGDGPLRATLEQLASKTLRYYRFLGVQPPDRVRAWMNRAKVFSVPSTTASSGDAEGFGMVFAEAQAMGLPIASFAAGGVPEIVAHGKTGFLVSERDWEALARHILLLLKVGALWHRFSAAGQSRARALFDVRKQSAILEQVYKRLLRETEIGK